MTGTTTMKPAQPDWLTDLKISGKRYSEISSWPSPAEEEWRRTDLSDIDIDAFFETDDSEQSPAGSVPPFDVSAHIVVHGGRKTSVPESMKSGLKIFSLTDAVPDEISGNVLPLLEKAVSRIDNRFQGFNYASLDAGILVYAPKGVSEDVPVLVDFSAAGSLTNSRPHLVVYAEPGSSVTVVQRFISPDSTDSILFNAAWEVYAGPGARVRFVTINETGGESLLIGNGYADVSRDGVLETFEAHTGGKLVKTRFQIDLLGTGADALINGLFTASDNRHIDMRTVQRHESPRAGSRSFYYGTASDGGRSIYQGLIEVGAEASGTDAYLTNKNLILDETARADAIPSLDIKTNDVKCSHGSTTGRIDEDQLFYLMSRGYSKTGARRIIIDGFFEEALGRAPAQVREYIAGLVCTSTDGYNGQLD